MKKIILLIFTVFLVISITDLQGQNLKRRGTLGIKAVDINDSTYKYLLDSCLNRNDNKESIPVKGIFVWDIMPDLTAEKMKIQKNDVIIKINETDIESIGIYRNLMKSLREGDNISITINRSGNEIIVRGKMSMLPLETSEKYDIIYDEVKFKDGYLRLIINKPKGQGKFKSILFIPGYMCYSLDNIGKHPYGQVVDKLCEAGYVVMRCEKPGMGDCMETPDCFDIDYFTELDAFMEGYKKLMTYDFADKENLFVFGHSLGGYEAPMVAEKLGAKGVIVCGTGLKSWFEYIIEMYRFQNIIMGVDYIENEKIIQKMIPVLYDFLIKKKSPEDILKENPDCKELMKDWLEYTGGRQVWSRDYTFWQQLQDINVPEIWKNVTGYVLVIRGEADFEAFSDSDHQEIVNIVNHYHPGNGKFLLIPDMDHGFAKSKTPAESYVNRQKKGYYYENFNDVIISEIDKWIKQLK